MTLERLLRMSAAGHGPGQGLGKLLPFNRQPCSNPGPALRDPLPPVSPSRLRLRRLPPAKFFLASLPLPLVSLHLAHYHSFC